MLHLKFFQQFNQNQNYFLVTLSAKNRTFPLESHIHRRSYLSISFKTHIAEKIYVGQAGNSKKKGTLQRSSLLQLTAKALT